MVFAIAVAGKTKKSTYEITHASDGILRPLKNLAIFTILKKTMDFFEVTGGLRLVEPPARREECCLFVTYEWGNPQAPIYQGNAEGLRLGEPPARRGQNSPITPD
ncbi:MAG: hypothetical protein R6T98_14615 [Desulfatiglandales bacterium]